MSRGWPAWLNQMNIWEKGADSDPGFANRIELSKYEEAPFFMRQAMRDFGLADPSMKGSFRSPGRGGRYSDSTHSS